MNGKFKITVRILFPSFLLLLLTLGCKKIFEIKEIHDKDKFCRVLTINSSSSTGPTGGPITAQFTYNKNGDPSMVLFSQVGTGRPNLIFRYDKYGRLSDYAGIYGVTSGGYEFWYHYQYQNDRIVSDSLFGFGNFNGTTFFPSTEFAATEQFQYDKYGRISQVVIEFPLVPGISPITTTYNYDNNGNLVPTDPANADYDNRVNIHRTSDVWMFVDRNYSVNNPVKAISYNASGLPLSFNHTSPPFEGFLYNLDISRSTIVYQCTNGKDYDKKD